MRKHPSLRTLLTTSALAVSFTGAQAACGSETPLPLSSGLAFTIGKLPARAAVSSTSAEFAPSSEEDKDAAVLATTLHQNLPLGPVQCTAMIGAAERRYERQVRRAATLNSSDVIREAVFAELDSRRNELDLAHVRRVIEMQRAARRQQSDLLRAVGSIRWENPMRKFEGTASFHAADLEVLSTEFEQQFHRPVPITARGETRTHVRLGLDHRGRYDVGVNPETPEGIWLRRTLESRQIPYIAFRHAIRGVATAPHIHIGLPSHRLKPADLAAFRAAFARQEARVVRISSFVPRHRAHKSQVAVVSRPASHAAVQNRSNPT